MSRYRHNGRIGALRVALDCARSANRHPSLQATLRNNGPKLATGSTRGSSKVKAVLEDKAKPKLTPEPRVTPRDVDEVILAAERILAEAGG